MYPNTQAEMPLQSHLFGHRLKSSQTKYEYLLEFLLVAMSPKSLSKSTLGNAAYEEMFPIDERIKTMNLQYSPKIRMGLKRFIFFSKGKLDGKAPIDKEAYQTLLRQLEEKMNGKGNYKDHLFLLENLLSGYTATEESRSWFVQCLLPICPEVIFPESMGPKKLRFENTEKPDHIINIDYDFDFLQRTYLSRGGEIYYLHVLQGMQDYPEFRDPIQNQLHALLHAYPAFSQLSQFIQSTWEDYVTEQEGQAKKNLKMSLTGIPEEFSKRSHYTLIELKNLLESNCHPFEKMELLSNGLLIQMLSLMYQKASTETQNNYWVIDVNSPDFDNKEMKKFAQNQFLKNEDMVKHHLYSGFEELQDVLKEKDEKKSIIDGYKSTVDIFRKLGKLIGLIIPITGPGMRFTLSEELIKFLVLALIPPNSMMTLDDFLEVLHTHYNMVIGPDEYKKEIGNQTQVAELPFLEDNKRAFAQKMKDCGFLRDLSDATAIVENPYPKKEVTHETIG